MDAKQDQPRVSFSLEARPATIEQREAGKRLFTRLIARAYQQDPSEATAKARAQAVAAAPPAVAQTDAAKPPSPTNRGAGMYGSEAA